MSAPADTPDRNDPVTSQTTSPQSGKSKPESSSVSAILVGAGMLLSRVSGFVRMAVFSKLFGTTDVADAFLAALKIPNFLQNLLGEGVLSASLIPVYSEFLQKQRQEEADRIARAVLGLLTLISSALVLIGVAAAPYLIPVVAPGFPPDKRELTIELVRILFPGIGLLVWSAWCLAILNSHRKFFLSYFAPVLWNAAMVVTMLVWRHQDLPKLSIYLAWGTVAGSAFQFGVQVPVVWRIMAGASAATRNAIDVHVRRVLTSAIPVAFSRGVVQVSSYIDQLIVTLLPTGATAVLGYATQLYQLPIGLFGMSVSSAALPSLSAAVSADVPEVLRARLLSGQQAITALVVPSMVAFLAFGDVMIAMLFQRGRFTHDDTLYAWGALAGSSVGLLATTIGRLYSSAFYALRDTRTPMVFAIIRVALVVLLGFAMALKLPPMLGIPMSWGTAGLTASAGIAGWIEFLLLRHTLRRRIGAVTIPASFLVKAWLVAAAAAIPATALRWAVPGHLLIVRGLVILGAFGLLYLALADRAGVLKVSEVRSLLGRRRRK